MSSQENRVAVVAIHGVADQKPHDTAQRICDLLLGLKQDNITYPGFNRTRLRVPLRAVAFDRALSRGEPPDRFRVDPRAQCMKQVQQRAPGQSIRAALAEMYPVESGAGARAIRSDDEAGLLDHAYMSEQLSEYNPEHKDGLYESVRLSGSRISPAQDPCKVDIYEMFWADLSRLGSGLLRTLVEFYQLLFSLCGLGARSLDFAHAHHAGDWRWKWFSGAQYFAEQLLTLAIPVLNLCLLGLCSVLLPLCLPVDFRSPAVAGSSALVVGILLGWALYLFRYKINPDLW